MEYKAVKGREFGKEVSNKLGLENARRIIIDINVNGLVLIYTELVGDERLYNINMDKFPIDIDEVPDPREVDDPGGEF